MANVLSTPKRVAIVSALIEGNSIRATARMVGCSKNTVTKLLVDLGAACSEYQGETIRNLPCKRVQVDEIWSFCQMKQKTARQQGREHEHGVGDVWTSPRSAPTPSSCRPGWSEAATVERRSNSAATLPAG